MNATLFVMASTVAAGGDVTPAGWADPPPGVVRGQGCVNCGSSQTPTVPPACDPCGKSRPRLLERLRNRFGKSDDGCPPAPVPAPTHACGTCTTAEPSRPNLLDRFRARRAARKGSADCGGCNTCGSSPVGTYPGTIVPSPCCSAPLPPTTSMVPGRPVAPATPGTPTELPKVMEKAKGPKGSDVKPAVPKGATPAPEPKPIDPTGAGFGRPAGPRYAGPVVLPPLATRPSISATRTGGR